MINSIYKFIMIKITNLTLILNHPKAIFITNKQLKMSTGTTTYLTKNVGRQMSEGIIKWDDTVSFPFTNVINFEITTKHQFGYNPQQLQAVIQGSIILSQTNIHKDLKTLSIQVTNLNGVKMGFLKLDIRRSNKTAKSINNISAISTLKQIQEQIQNIPKISHSPPKTSQQKIGISASIQAQILPKQTLKITSLVAHIDHIKGKTVNITIKSAKNSTKTEQFTSKSGELVYIGSYQLQIQNKQSKLIAQIHAKNQQLSLIGKAIFMIDLNGKVNKKGSVIDSSGKEVGQMFIDCNMVKKGKKGYFLTQRHSQGTQLRLDHSAADLMKSNSVAKKKLSIMSSNNDIRFSKEKRFFQLQSKKSEYVSYQGFGNFQFKEIQSNKYYKGASIGRGSKVDFIAQIRANPGVGEYRLPSIWDRY